MKENKPIKRSKELAPLSRDHHHALLFNWKLKQGIKNKTPIKEMAEYISWFWDNHLKPHFGQEEKILLPYLASADPLAQQLINEHREILSLISGEINNETILELVSKLEAHIRFEERKLFPHIENKVTAEELNKIFSQLEEHETCKTEWKNEFWK